MMIPPEKGDVRWSGFFGAYISLQRFVNDDRWFFKLVLPSPDLTHAARALPDLAGIYRNQTPWSLMPLHKP